MLFVRFFAKMSSKACYLSPIGSHNKIELPHLQQIIIGRTVETEIQDLYVSKKQLELCADHDNHTVKVKCIGRAVCGIDGYAIMKEKTYTIGHGHIIEVRLGFHQYQVVFDPPPIINQTKWDDTQDETSAPVAKKPKIDFSLFSVDKTKDDGDNFSGDGKWESMDKKQLLIYTPNRIHASPSIAAFDMDGTIITTKSGAKFPKSIDDWIFYMSDIPQKLKKLYDDGYKIVFFTNQGGIGNNQAKNNEFKFKIENILKRIPAPIQIFVASGISIYRKPAPGMWDVLQKEKNDGVEIDKEKSFYVGDAAGRDKTQPRKYKDHSCVDRLFALNIGVKFYTPEEYFRNQKPESYKMPDFNPVDIVEEPYPEIDYESPNVILMVGGPGSGKSHFCRRYLIPKGYTHVSRDKLGSWQKCVKQLEESLRDKRNVVIDNTNMDKESRARFIEVAKKFGVKCRCFVMKTSFAHAKHNNRFRELTDKTHVPVSDIIIHSLKNNYQEPEVAEGFEEILNIPFLPSFGSDEHEKLYKLHLLEK